jgi:bifunctional non-homologous end joining protein LigD
MHLDGYDITPSPLVARKDALREVMAMAPADGLVRLSEHFEEQGPIVLKHACQMKLEGIISKRRDAPYRSGRTGDWIKAKCTNRQEFVITGYEPSDKNSRAIRSLVLGYYDKDGLRYAGRVGTGFTEATERDLVRRMKSLQRDQTPFDAVPAEERRRKVVWVEPKLVSEIEFRGWTHGNVLRQGAFKGVRDDKPAKEVVREVSAMPTETKQAALRQTSAKKTAAPRARSTGNKRASISGSSVTLSHPERVYWEDVGITKQDLADYYVKVWDWMAPHVTRRVLALVRCPEGATAECFFQKHASAGVEQSHLHLVPEPDGDRSISIDDLDGLLSLVQAGVLEIHVRGTTIDHLEEADRLVFDLDPGPGIEWKDIIAGARDVRQRLKALGLESFVKTTGGKGLHVVLPIAYAPWDIAKDFCRRVAESMVADSPDRYTATVKKAARTNKIFVDYLRNSREATAIAAYSTRARPGATVSVPVTWEELGKLKVPNGFNVQNLPARLKRLRKDPWADIGKIRQKLPAKGLVK